MSNIANQLVAVAATLAGFVAHDLLTQHTPAPVDTIPTLAAAIDPITTRAIALDDLSVSDWLSASLRAEREALRAPGAAPTLATGPARPGAHAMQARIADARANDLRFDDSGRRNETAFLR